MNTISFEQSLAAHINTLGSDKLLIEQPYDYKSVFINKVKPDSSNPRFFPAIIISDLHAYQMSERKISKQELVKIYEGENKVLIGKGCIINCFKYGSVEWKKANQSIESIIELAGNVAISEIIQVPTIYPISNGYFQILTGHRRFFAIIYANGIESAAHFKVYEHCPLLPKTKQFQENASREELPQYGKLQAFSDAIKEIEILNDTRARTGYKALSVRQVASTLGISMGTYDNYNVLTRYPCVSQAYADGCTTTFVQMKKLVLQVEAGYKEEFGKKVLNINDKREIDNRIQEHISQCNESKKSERSRRAVSYNINKISSVRGLKMLLTADVTTYDTGVNWDNVDWSNSKLVMQALSKVVEYLNKES